MSVEGRSHVRNVGCMVALSLLGCHHAAGFVALPPSAAGAMRVVACSDQRPSLGFAHQGHRLIRKRRTAHLLRCGHRNDQSHHHRRRTLASPTRHPDDRRETGGSRRLADFFSTVGGRRFTHGLAAAAADSSPAEPGAKDDDDGRGGGRGGGDGSIPEHPPPSFSSAAAPAGTSQDDVIRGEASAGASAGLGPGPAGAETAGRGTGAAAAAAVAAAAVVVVEEKGREAGARRDGDGGGKLHAAAGPPAWVPRWAVDMHPAWQAAASVGLYFFHMLHLSKSGMTFPVQLVPNNHGLFQSIGLDTAAGFAVLGVVAWSRLRSGLPLFPPLGAAGEASGAYGVAKGESRGNSESGGSGGRNRSVWDSVKVPWKLLLHEAARMKKKLPLTFAVLIMAYLLSGLGSTLSEYLLYGLSYLGFGMSVAMHRSLQVLMSHLMWVYMGVKILSLAVKSFFDREKGSWVGMKWKSNWLWWVVGGYFVSSSLFNMADLANQFLCPLPPDTESVVVKIINPENNDVAAMAVGSIAPCISAPWWEEVLYRGFLLPALTLYLPLKAALPAGSFLFAAHHMNLQAMLPLSVLGLVWSLLYLYSGNLLVTVLIHAMWNSRVFLGSLLGL